MVEKFDFSADDKRRDAERAERRARFQKEMAAGMKADAERIKSIGEGLRKGLADDLSRQKDEKVAADETDREKILATQEKIRDIERRLES